MQSVLVFKGVVFLCFVHLILSSNVTMRSGRTCAQNGDITVELQCSVNERIHVEQESYGYGVTNPCRLLTNGSCIDVLQTSIHGLVVNCNGKQSCNETVSRITCTIAAAAVAEVHYMCINDSMDICGFNTIIAAAKESVYLHSPGYPYSVGMNKSCMVRITGKSIQVTLVDQSLNGGNLIILGNGNKKWSNVNATLYNRKLKEQYSEVAISYTDGGNDRSNVWISVVGSSSMSITFNGGMITTSETSTSFVPMSEGSLLLHDVTSQRMSVTQPVMPTSTLSTDTQTLSTVSTNALFTTMVTDTVSVTTTATTEVTSKTAAATMKIAPTITPVAENRTVGMTSNETTHIPQTPDASDKENRTVGMTSNETTHIPQTPDASDKDLVVVVASIAACSVVAVIVVVVVAVVLCRCKNDKTIRSATFPHNRGIDRPLELHSPHNRTPDGLRKHDDSQHYFIIDPAFVPGNGDVSLNTDSRGKKGTRALRVQDGYSTVLPRSSRINMNENNTFAIKHPRCTPSPDILTGSNEHKHVEDTESPGTGDLKADTDQLESMDSFLFDRKISTKSTCHMIENDVYSGGPPTEIHDVSIDDGNQDEESTPEDDVYPGEEDVRDGTIEGMVDNDIYESSGYVTTVAEPSGECEEVSVSATRDINTAGSAKEEVDMMPNDLYHSFV